MFSFKPQCPSPKQDKEDTNILRLDGILYSLHDTTPKSSRDFLQATASRWTTLFTVLSCDFSCYNAIARTSENRVCAGQSQMDPDSWLPISCVSGLPGLGNHKDGSCQQFPHPHEILVWLVCFLETTKLTTFYFYLSYLWLPSLSCFCLNEHPRSRETEITQNSNANQVFQ